jgi:hypothetical protein
VRIERFCAVLRGRHRNACRANAGNTSIARTNGRYPGSSTIHTRGADTCVYSAPIVASRSECHDASGASHRSSEHTCRHDDASVGCTGSGNNDCCARDSCGRTRCDASRDASRYHASCGNAACGHDCCGSAGSGFDTCCGSGDARYDTSACSDNGRPHYPRNGDSNTGWGRRCSNRAARSTCSGRGTCRSGRRSDGGCRAHVARQLGQYLQVLQG